MFWSKKQKDYLKKNELNSLMDKIVEAKDKYISDKMLPEFVAASFNEYTSAMRTELSKKHKMEFWEFRELSTVLLMVPMKTDYKDKSASEVKSHFNVFELFATEIQFNPFATAVKKYIDQKHYAVDKDGAFKERNVIDVKHYFDDKIFIDKAATSHVINGGDVLYKNLSHEQIAEHAQNFEQYLCTIFIDDFRAKNTLDLFKTTLMDANLNRILGR